MSGDMQLDHWTYGDFYRAFRYYLISKRHSNPQSADNREGSCGTELLHADMALLHTVRSNRPKLKVWTLFQARECPDCLVHTLLGTDAVSHLAQ